eukprot:766386-Hanusia_phi.AAC.3
MESQWKNGYIQALQKDDLVLVVYLRKFLTGSLEQSIQLATVTSLSPISKVCQPINRLVVNLKLQDSDEETVKNFQKSSEIYGIIDPRCGFFGFQTILNTLQMIEAESLSPVLAQLELTTQSFISKTPKYLTNIIWDFECLLDPTKSKELHDNDLKWFKEVPAEVLQDNLLKSELIKRLQEISYLDPEQTDAVVNTLQRSLAITQGPPGTGKTFLGVSIVKMLIENKRVGPRSPLLCVCYTNHALDQFLEHVLGVYPQLNLVRLGTRTRSERLSKYLMKNLMPAISNDRRISDSMRNAFGRLTALAREYEAEIDAHERMRKERHFSWKNIKEFLEIRFPNIYHELIQAEAVVFQSGFTLQGKSDIFNLWTEPFSRDNKKQKKSKARPKSPHNPSNMYDALQQDQGDALQQDQGDPSSSELEASLPRSHSEDQDHRLEDNHESLSLQYLFPPEEQVSLSISDPNEIDEIKDIWKLSLETRKRIAAILEELFDEAELQYLVPLYKSLNDIYQERRQLQAAQQIEYLKEYCTIIGCTVTGLSKFNDLVNGLKSPVVLIEEAAEILEAQTLSLLGHSVEHAILIGDHQQLRPKVNLYELTTASKKGYDIDRSLFERLVEDRDAPTCVLKRQYRMRPEISKLVRQTIYPDLVDAQRVTEYPPVKGMVYPVFFWNHSVAEDSFQPREMKYQTQEGSKTNTYEVACVVALVSYLVKQGYARDQITVLTGYLGQSVLITKELKRLSFSAFLGEQDSQEATLLLEEQSLSEAQPSKSGIRVATVDNYQGEENDILILSLVRSNPKQMSGFMKVENRVNVLLSRAKHGMYLIGDKDTLTFRDETWSNVIRLLSESSSVGDAVPIVCQRHPQDVRLCQNPRDFQALAQDGGCMLPCGTRLTCGHACPKSCHPDGHLGFECRQPCTRRPRECQRQHQCRRFCFEDCGKCEETIEVVLPCGHTAAVKCWMSAEPKKFFCSCKVTVKMPVCGHEVEVGCSLSEEYEDGTRDCPVPCGGLLKCGHVCTSRCGTCLRAGCIEMGKDFLTCAYRDIVPLHPARCDVKCQQKLSNLCGHVCNAPCHGFHGSKCGETLCREACILGCQHSLCHQACGNLCMPCMQSCDWECEHISRCGQRCFAPCDRLPCNERCSKLLPCGHRCPSVCGEPCAYYEKFCPLCDRTGEVRELQVDLLTFETLGETDLDKNPLVLFPCQQHVLQMDSADAHMELSKVYLQDAEGNFKGLRELQISTSDFFSNKLCPFGCGRTSSDGYQMKRYGRVVNVRNAVLCQQKVMINTNLEVSQCERLLETGQVSTAFQRALDLHKQLEKYKNDIACNLIDVKSSCKVNERLAEPLPAFRAKAMNVLLSCACQLKTISECPNFKRVEMISLELAEDLVKLQAFSSFMLLTDNLMRFYLQFQNHNNIAAVFRKFLAVLDSELPSSIKQKMLYQAMCLSSEVFKQNTATCTREIVLVRLEAILNVFRSCMQSLEPEQDLTMWEKLMRSFIVLRQHSLRCRTPTAQLDSLREVADMVRDDLEIRISQLRGSDNPDIVQVVEGVSKQLHDRKCLRRSSPLTEPFRSWDFFGGAARVPSLARLQQTDIFILPTKVITEDTGTAAQTVRLGLTLLASHSPEATGHPYVIADCGGAMETSSCFECGAPIGGERHQLLGDNRVIKSGEEMVEMSRASAMSASE